MMFISDKDSHKIYKATAEFQQLYKLSSGISLYF